MKPRFWQTVVDAWKFKPLYSPFEYIEESTIRLRAEKKSIPAAYSYILLHIMCDYAMKKGIYVKFRNVQLKEKLNINGHEKLIKVQYRLRDIIFNNAPEMVYYDRYVLEKEIENCRPGGPDFSFYHENLGWLNDEIPIEPTAGQPIEIEPFITDPDLITKIKDHNMILMLRSEYLHWSADCFEIGFNPTQSGRRQIYEG